MQTCTLWRGNQLGMRRAPVAQFVPLHAGLGIVTVRCNLHGGARPMFVVPADHADQFLPQSVPPQAELILLDRMHAELGSLARAYPLRPHVAQQPVREEPKLVRCIGQIGTDNLGAKAWFAQSDAIRPAGQVAIQSAPW